MTTSAAPTAPRAHRVGYWRTLWLLTRRDLTVRYSTSALGYLWSIIDPLVMAAMYWFVFGVLFQRPVGESPYVVFLLCALLPWVWFNTSISDSTRAFVKDAKLVRSTRIPRTIWVARIIASKGIEFLASLPVLAIFALATGAVIHPGAWLAPLAIAIQLLLTVGLGLLIAPAVVFFHDFERAVKLALRVGFYASPVVYGIADLERIGLGTAWAFNPLTGIISLYRSAFFPAQLDWFAVAVSAAMSVVIFIVGVVVFRRSEAAVLKEL